MLVPTNQKTLFFFHKKTRLHFLHIPKCGGTYVEASFTPWIQKCETRVLPGSKGHLTFLEYDRLFAAAGVVRPQTWFTVIRNPWDWHASWFHYIKKDVGGKASGMPVEAELFQKFSFADYLGWLEDPEAPSSPQRYMHKQMRDYLVNEQGELVVQHVLRQENLEEELRGMAAKLDLLLKPVSGRFNASERAKDYRAYYDDRTAAIVARRHADDIRLWGYQFE
jgi:hypothetical protein